MSVGRVIRGSDCVAEGAKWLEARDEGMARALLAIDEVPLRLRPDGFAQLLSAIVSQQVSVASANAIWARVQAAGLNDPARVAGADDEALRAVGLSRPKVRYARALAMAGIDYPALREMPSDEVIKTLVAVPGIGLWTAEIYAMFSLGRADVFAPGDLALQEAAKVLYGLKERPKEKAFREMALRWSPWRSVAARVLWAYYRVAKDREGIR
ncbi:DNA-3-methyladenine glycosylase 2 family protein [Alisedimentitalea sp. MJ-SS2]|uniref:DNA-3-methyladenine glycosylase family protein n=1 Tax=Aliisedimentitalea sp. MJ-SS2 TaxID=3049795 RepID=UPI00290A039B|nr:DNA-3-methyladenine glycosylase 2 family protein [Alisedimentitalea sp. MJ-SS2]MDU8926435.1 DNA-3-methyladenine glycosylase 2 family protein [Alisedimentitalea sp. MJ-SS2]